MCSVGRKMGNKSVVVSRRAASHQKAWKFGSIWKELLRTLSVQIDLKEEITEMLGPFQRRRYNKTLLTLEFPSKCSDIHMMFLGKIQEAGLQNIILLNKPNKQTKKTSSKINSPKSPPINI